MVSRRLLRIKAMQMLYAFHTTENPSLSKYENELFHSIDKIHELYHLLLYLIVDISDYFNERIEISKNKFIPTAEEKNPNTRFIENKIVQQIANNNQLKKFCSNHKLSWNEYPELIRRFYNEIKDSEAYVNYMSSKEQSYQSDKELLVNIYETIIAPSVDLHDILEEKSIYWNDDIEFVVSMIIKTFTGFQEKQNNETTLLPLFKNEDDRETALIMVKEVERINRSITQLLEFAKPLAVEKKDVDLREMIDHSLKLIHHDLEQKGIKTEVILDTRKTLIYTDGDRMNQVLLNLYINALAALTRGGTLAVGVKDADRKDWVEIRVKDNGTGIDEAFLDQIFDPYVTGRPTGTGLGLSIVHRIIENLGGSIRVESKKGRGACFIINLPVS